MSVPILKIQVSTPGHRPECFFHRCESFTGAIFREFTMNLFERYPTIYKNSFKMSWFDNDGDRITLSNESDMQIFVELKGKKLFVEVDDARTSRSSEKAQEKNDDAIIPVPLTETGASLKRISRFTDCETMTKTKTPNETRHVDKDRPINKEVPDDKWKFPKVDLKQPEAKESKCRDSCVVSPLESVAEDVTPVLCPLVERTSVPNENGKLDNLLPEPRGNAVMDELAVLQRRIKSGDNSAQLRNIGGDVLNMLQRAAINKPPPNNDIASESKVIENNRLAGFSAPPSETTAAAPVKPTTDPFRWPSPIKVTDIENRPLNTNPLSSNKPSLVTPTPYATWSSNNSTISGNPRWGPPRFRDANVKDFENCPSLMGSWSWSSNWAPLVTPEEPKAPNSFQSEAVCQLLAMGFKNDDGMLTRLVQSAGGNIDSALNILLSKN